MLSKMSFLDTPLITSTYFVKYAAILSLMMTRLVSEGIKEGDY